MKKVKKGGVGVWGQIPMPPNAPGERRGHQDPGEVGPVAEVDALTCRGGDFP